MIKVYEIVKASGYGKHITALHHAVQQPDLRAFEASRRLV